MAIGIISNSAFLFTVWRIPRMKTTFNIYLQNLAVADLIFIAIPTTLSLCHFFSPSLFESSFCLSFYFVSSSLHFVSIGMITLVAIERYLAIRKPIQHRSLTSKKRTRTLVIGVWIGSLILGSLAAPLYGKSETFCVRSPDFDKYANFLTIRRTCIPIGEDLVWVILPSFILLSVFATGFLANIFAYGKIIYSFSKQGLANSASHLRRHLGREKISSDIRIRNQILHTMIINSVVLFLTNAPYRIIIILKLIHTVQTKQPGTTKQAIFTTELVALNMVILNSVINSFIYGFSSSFYRQAFREAFGCSNFSTNVGAKRLNIKTNASKTKGEIDNVTNDTMCWKAKDLLLHKSLLFEYYLRT